MDDDAESIITNQRYAYINGVVDKAVKKKARAEHLTVSDKIDQIVTNRILALPIFAAIMWLMYAIAMGSSVADGASVSALCHRLDQRCSVRRDRPQRPGRLLGTSALPAGCTA